MELCERLIASRWDLNWVRAAYIHHFGQQSYSQVDGGYIERQKARVAKRFERRGPG